MKEYGLNRESLTKEGFLSYVGIIGLTLASILIPSYYLFRSDIQKKEEIREIILNDSLNKLEKEVLMVNPLDSFKN